MINLYLYSDKMSYISETPTVTFYRNMAKNLYLDHIIFETQILEGIAIEENPSGNILIEKFHDKITGNNSYYRIYTDSKSKTSEWVKRFRNIQMP